MVTASGVMLPLVRHSGTTRALAFDVGGRNSDRRWNLAARSESVKCRDGEGQIACGLRTTNKARLERRSEDD
jgi:hypothetical protein